MYLLGIFGMAMKVLDLLATVWMIPKNLQQADSSVSD